MRLRATAAATGALLFWAAAASAQVNADTPESAQLAREFTDPLTTLPQLFFRDTYTPANYGTDAPANRVIARVIVPRVPRISLFPDQLIRPSFQLVTVPTGKGTQYADTLAAEFRDRSRDGARRPAAPQLLRERRVDGLPPVRPGGAADHRALWIDGGLPAVAALEARSTPHLKLRKSA